MTPLELFFDLVFVLSFTQVTATIAEDPTWEGLGEGMLILAAVWWAWAAYGWLTNAIDADENLNRLAMFAAMAAMLIVSLAIPEAFGDLGLLFGCAYFVRAGACTCCSTSATPAATGDEDNLGAILKLAPGLLLGSALLVVAGALDGGARSSLWIVALADRLRTPLLFGTEEFNIQPGHFAERHGLIVIIALGESIVAIGAGAASSSRRGEVVAAVLGDRRGRRALVGLLRRRRDRRRAPADRGAAGRAGAARPRLLQLPALPDDRRHRAARRRPEEDRAGRRRAAEDGARGRALRRRRALPARPHRLPLPQRRHPQPRTARWPRSRRWR